MYFDRYTGGSDSSCLFSMYSRQILSKLLCKNWWNVSCFVKSLLKNLLKSHSLLSVCMYIEKGMLTLEIISSCIIIINFVTDFQIILTWACVAVNFISVYFRTQKWLIYIELIGSFKCEKKNKVSPLSILTVFLYHIFL